jgi:multidrug resistance efflux pump
MSQGTDQQADARAAAASLAAEAALLEGRLRLLREAIAAVDARIESVSESLRRSRLPGPFNGASTT